MSLDKAIKSGKEKRKPYMKSKSFDASCRNHGSCLACQSNRLIRTLKGKESINQQLKDAESL